MKKFHGLRLHGAKRKLVISLKKAFCCEQQLNLMNQKF